MATKLQKNGADINGPDGKPIVMNMTVAKFQLIRTKINWDPMEIGANRFAEFKAIVDDPARLLPMLHVALGGSFDEFGDLMRGDALDAAVHAFVYEVTDFFPATVRESHRATWTEIIDTQLSLIPETIQNFRAEVRPIVAQKITAGMKQMANAYQIPQQPTSGG